jgi:hypothetical protein
MYVVNVNGKVVNIYPYMLNIKVKAIEGEGDKGQSREIIPLLKLYLYADC